MIFNTSKQILLKKKIRVNKSNSISRDKTIVFMEQINKLTNLKIKISTSNIIQVLMIIVIIELKEQKMYHKKQKLKLKNNKK